MLYVTKLDDGRYDLSGVIESEAELEKVADALDAEVHDESATGRRYIVWSDTSFDSRTGTGLRAWHLVVGSWIWVITSGPVAGSADVELQDDTSSTV